VVVPMILRKTERKLTKATPQKRPGPLIPC
jgi:hypothetical protein